MRQPFFEVKWKCFQYLHLNNTKQITQSNLSERSSKVNALQSQKITRQNAPELGKNGKNNAKNKIHKISVQKEVRTQNT